MYIVFMLANFTFMYIYTFTYFVQAYIFSYIHI